jgi:alkylation response protein AidB-like acyl-CoA dehydrogenase
LASAVWQSSARWWIQYHLAELSAEVDLLRPLRHHGVGYMDETWTSRFFRDSRLLSIGGGTDG